MSSGIDFTGMLEKMKDFPDDKFPNMLFSPVINDFGEDIGRFYWQEYDETNELTNKMMTLSGKKYKDINQYYDALDTWYEYIDPLVEKYGSVEIVMDAARRGILDEFVSAMPKLKMTKMNKMYLKNGVLPSPQYFKPSYDHIRESFRYLEKGWENIPDTSPTKISKSMKKTLERSSRNLRTKDRITAFKKGKNSAAFEITQGLMRSLQDGSYRSDIRDSDDLSLSELVAERKRIDETPDFILDDERTYDCKITVDASGRFRDSKSMEKNEIVRCFLEAGFSPERLGARVGMKQKKIYMIADDMLGDLLPGQRDSKAYKKMMKKKKKKQKKLQKRFSESGDLTDMMNQLVGNFTMSDSSEFTNWNWGK